MRRPRTLFERMSRAARQPSAAEIAAMPLLDPDDEDDGGLMQDAREAAAIISGSPSLFAAFLDRSTESGLVVEGMTARRLGELRELGVVDWERMLLTPVGRAARGLCIARRAAKGRAK